MRQRRLLNARSQRGSVPLDFVFAVVLLMTLALGAIDVALLLFARNVVKASAYEAARSAIEREGDDALAQAAARETVTSSVGGLVDDVMIELDRVAAGAHRLVAVEVRCRVSLVAPIPISIPVSGRARAIAEAEPR